jgi:hypothetical protein
MPGVENVLLAVPIPAPRLVSATGAMLVWMGVPSPQVLAG